MDAPVSLIEWFEHTFDKFIALLKELRKLLNGDMTEPHCIRLNWKKNFHLVAAIAFNGGTFLTTNKIFLLNVH